MYLQAQSDDWLVRLMTYVDKSKVYSFHRIPIVRLKSGEHVVPKNTDGHLTALNRSTLSAPIQIGFTHLIGNFDYGGMSQARTLNSIQKFSSQVMPSFKNDSIFSG